MRPEKVIEEVETLELEEDGNRRKIEINLGKVKPQRKKASLNILRSPRRL